jgi:hypothetical protein
MSLYEHFDKAAPHSAQLQAVNWRLQRRIHKLVATSVEWTLHYFKYTEREGCDKFFSGVAQGRLFLQRTSIF